MRTLDPTDLRAIADMEFSADGRLLAILDSEGLLRIWDVDRQAPLAPPHRLSDPKFGIRIVGFATPRPRGGRDPRLERTTHLGEVTAHQQGRRRDLVTPHAERADVRQGVSLGADRDILI